MLSVCKYLPLGVLLSLLCACSVFSANHSVYFQDGEGRFSESLLNAVTPGKTTRQWLEAHFGPPLYAEPGPDSVEMLTWQFIRQERTDREMFLLLRQRRITEHQHYLHAVVERDQVVQSWRNNFAKPDADRVMRALGYRQPRPEATTAGNPKENPSDGRSQTRIEPTAGGWAVQPERVVVEEVAVEAVDVGADPVNETAEPLAPELTDLLKPAAAPRPISKQAGPSATQPANDPLYRL